MKFRLSFTRFASILVAAALLNGCIFSPDKTTGTEKKPYFPWTSVENALTNLQNLYINRDFQKYDECLSSDYVFQFQADDIQPGQVTFLSRSEELNFAENLFSKGSPDGTLQAASRIQLTLNKLSDVPDPRVGHDGWRRVNAQTSLTLTFPDGSTNSVNGPADLYFRQVDGLWRLAEWKDIKPTT